MNAYFAHASEVLAQCAFLIIYIAAVLNQSQHLDLFADVAAFFLFVALMLKPKWSEKIK